MDFMLTKQHEMARTLFREFAEKEVKPLAQEVDETEVFPRGTVEKMAKAGFLGIPVPKEYGGQGCDILTYAMCVEELSKVCGTTGVIVSAHTSLCCDPILTYGTEEQKQKYLPDLASGRKIGAFGLTEPGAGTDAQGQQTKAVLEGDEWVPGTAVHRDQLIPPLRQDGRHLPGAAGQVQHRADRDAAAPEELLQIVRPSLVAHVLRQRVVDPRQSFIGAHGSSSPRSFRSAWRSKNV